MAQQELNDKLFEAVKNDDLDQVNELVGQGADVNAKDKFFGDTPLHKAIQLRNFEMVKLLIENGADVNAINGQDDTPLILSVAQSDLEFVKLLLENGAKVNAHGSDGNTALHVSLFLKTCSVPCASLKDIELEIIKLLVNHGADVDAKNFYEEIPLDWAHTKEQFMILIEHGATFTKNHINKIVQYGYTDVLEKLISLGANIKQPNAILETPLHIAAKYGQLETVKLLIKHGANPNQKTRLFGTTPLDLAQEKLKDKDLSNEKKQKIQSVIDYLKSLGTIE